MMGGARLHIRTQNIQRIEIIVHFGNHAIDQRDKAFAVLISTLNDFIVDIGNVAHVLQLIAEKTQVAGNHVKETKVRPWPM
jgi:endonuclease IV